MARASSLVVGVGNADRGDDGVGLEVVRALRPRLDRAVRLHESRGDLTELLDVWDGAGLTLVIDAVVTGARAGTVLRQEIGPSDPPPTIAAASTHAFSLAEAIGLAQVLDRRPERWVLYGIEAVDVAIGHAMSLEVAAAVPLVATRALVDLEEARRGAPADA